MSEKVGCLRVGVVWDCGPACKGCKWTNDSDKCVSDCVAELGFGVGIARGEVITIGIHRLVAVRARVFVVRVAECQWEAQLALPQDSDPLVIRRAHFGLLPWVGPKLTLNWA